jgi:phage tail sheath protein FI
MAQRMVSPGVFTEENDLTFIEEGVAEIGAAFIGPTLEGPAFRPIIVESPEEFRRTFGDTTPDMYTPLAVQTYLKEANRATIVRILGLDGYDSSLFKSVVLKISGSMGAIQSPVTFGIIHPSQIGVTIASSSISGTPTNFTLLLSGANGSKTYTSCSIDPSSANYFVKVLGSDPKTKQDGYVYASFPSVASYISGALAGSGSLSNTAVTTELNFSGSIYGSYTNASTPYVKSQKIGGNYYDVFKVFTRNDGNAANKKIKISIASIKPSPIATEYGTFSLLVRDFNDTDAKTSIFESFDNLTLDPTSPNYVARRIGTARTVIDSNGDTYLDGDWPNNSRYIYIAMATGAESAPINALPYGFQPLNASINLASIPAPVYVTTRYTTPSGSTVALADSRTYYGYNFADESSLSYLTSLPSGSTTRFGLTTANAADAGFNLLESLAATDLVDISPTTATAYRKFSVPFQGGFNGQNPAVVRNTGGSITATNTQGFDLSDSNKSGTRAYVQAITALSNADAWDINLLVTPGVVYSQHPYVVAQGISMCEQRGDCFYPIDADILGATTTAVINSVAGINSNYAATYHPWVKVLDTSSNKTIWVSPSVLIPGVYAFNDRVGAEWYAPAGLNRGGVPGAIQVRSRLSKSDRDDLYESRVNPIATFPGQGIVVWGQKTLQVEASAFDRINVRRLLIAVKKFIASTSRYLVFEQNVDATRNRFLGIVNPYLANIQERNGLFAFRVIMDDTNNTPDIIDRNILVGDLYLQPTRTAEFIKLNFNVLPTGATFPEG